MKIKMLALSIVLFSLMLCGCCGLLARGNNADRYGAQGPDYGDGGYGDYIPGYDETQLQPVTPDWIKPGLTVYYDGYSAFVKDGQYNSPVQTVWKYRVDSVDGNTFSGTASVTVPNTGLEPLTAQWTAYDGGTHDYRFWINPGNPAGSVTGTNGEPYRVVATMPYELNGKTYQATTLASSIPGTGAEFHITYDTETGLIIAQAIKYPTEEVYTYFNHMAYE